MKNSSINVPCANIPPVCTRIRGRRSCVCVQCVVCTVYRAAYVFVCVWHKSHVIAHIHQLKSVFARSFTLPQKSEKCAKSISSSSSSSMPSSPSPSNFLFRHIESFSLRVANNFARTHTFTCACERVANHPRPIRFVFASSQWFKICCLFFALDRFQFAVLTS